MPERQQDAGDVDHAAVVVLRDCLAVQPRETLLIVTDTSKASLARGFAKAARGLVREVLTVEYDVRKLDGQEPPVLVASAMAEADAVVAVTERSITFTVARRNATRAGARFAGLPRVTRRILARAVDVDQRSVARRARRLAQRMTGTGLLHLSDPTGTDLEIPVARQEPSCSTGILIDPGDWGELPTGHASLAVEPAECRGVLSISGSVVGVGTLREPIRMEVRNGRAVNVRGAGAGRRLAELLGQLDGPGGVITRIGVGANPGATVAGQPLEDASALGTVHVSFGDSAHTESTSRIAFAINAVLTEPTLTLDGTTLILAGRLLL